MASQTLPANPPLEAPLPQEILTQLYASMHKAQLLSKRWRNALCMSEAVLAGTLANSEAADLLVSAEPHPILEVLSGTAVASISSGKSRSTTQGESSATRVIVTGNDAAAPLAGGLALALKRVQSNSLVIAILPGKLTRGPAWDQATEFAAANRLPIVFVADGTDTRPTRKHDGRELSHWPFPTIAVDGRDVIAVYRVTKEAMSAARRGRGPTLVDCVNFVAPGNRGKDERDPLASFRGYLKRHNAWSDEWYKGLEKQLSREISGK
jgi:TPP-dependent pyruvate/acetoin dehydrogenase alpha subunit